MNFPLSLFLLCVKNTITTYQALPAKQGYRHIAPQ